MIEKRKRTSWRGDTIDLARTSISIFIFLFFFSILSFSQNFLVHRYSETEGLPSAIVFDAAQDTRGRMWFAARTGITVYDGVSWKTYTISDGLPSLTFIKIKADQKGRVWALSLGQSGFVVVCHDIHTENNKNKEDQWKIINGVQTGIKTVTSFQLLEQKNADKPTIAVGTSEKGIFLWNAFNQEKWKNLTTNHGLLKNAINGIASSKDKFYVATDQGLSIVTPRCNSTININNELNQSLHMPTQKIKGICIEDNNKFPDFSLEYPRIWFFGHQWLGCFDENSVKMTLFPVEIVFSDQNEIITISPDYYHGIYMSLKGELRFFNYNTRSWEFIGEDNGIIGGGANSIFIDFEKNIWLPGDRGINKVVSRRFSTWQRIHGLLEDEVTSILEYEPGKFILGHNFGVSIYNGNRFIKVSLSSKEDTSIPSPRAMDMKMDSRHHIWIAASQAGLAKINPRVPHKITWYGENNGLPGQMVAIWIAEKIGDKMWIATTKGIFLANEDKTKFKKLNNITARKIYGDQEKLCYIGSNHNGLYVYSEQEQQWKNYRVPGNRRANSIYAIKKDSQNRLLLGTLAGVLILENDTLKKFEPVGFQLDRPVYFILEDPKNRLWFGTDHGVVRWDGKTQRDYAAREGLVGLETNRAAAIVDSKGRIWFGTDRSVSIYNEQFDSKKSHIPSPKVQLTHIEVSNRDIPLTATMPVRLSYNENTVALHFQGISFLDERFNRFKHKLEGLETEWSKETYHYNQMVRYIKLPSGTYRFHLKAGNALGIWSDEVVSPKIIILRPYYQTWWFFLLIGLMVTGVFYGVYRYFSQRRQAAFLEKQMQEKSHQLQQVEKQYRDLFEESKDVVFMTTREGKLVDVNPAGLELFGYDSKEEALNINSIREIYYTDSDREEFKKEIFQKGYVKDHEVVLKRKDGEPLTCLVTASLVRSPAGEIVGFRGIIRDITRQKRLEQQLMQAQKMEAIGTLAGGIAHDFNNILGAIVGFTELALDDLPEGTLVRKNVQRVLIGAKRATELVKQILAFSRQVEQERKPLILGTIVKESLKLLRSSLPATIEIRRDIKADTGVILGDPTQIHQVMMNLGANAAHAMQEKGGILEIKLYEVVLDEETAAKNHNLKPGEYLRLSVSDTGHGIPKVVMKRIFDPYFTTKKTGEGTGLGLAVVHGIVKSHGGDISVYSEPGEGTTFHVFWPKIETDVKTDGPPKEILPGGSERVLFVDDEIALTEIGTQMLERLGYEVKGISNPLHALETFRKEPAKFQLVISDLTMPRMTGLQLAEEIRKIEPNIPFILCSGFSTNISDEQIKEFGINDFIMKPIIKSELAQVVRRVLDRESP